MVIFFLNKIAGDQKKVKFLRVFKFLNVVFCVYKRLKNFFAVNAVNTPI